MTPTLDTLTDKIIAAHAAAVGAFRASLNHAMEAGDLLNEARPLLPYGAWLPWLESTGIPERTAQLYMRLARHRAALEQAATVADLTVRQAAALLMSPRTTTAFAGATAATEAWLRDAEERLSSGNLEELSVLVEEAAQMTNGWANVTLRSERRAGELMGAGR